jgi:flotillin
MENIRVAVPSVFTVAVGTQTDVMQNAAIRLLGLSIAQVKKQAEDIILGQLRQVIASMKIEDINRDREKFLHSIQTSLEPELRKIGLVLINVNITDITDSSGYIEAIGQKAAAQAVQQARGDVADEEKMGEIRVAEAEREKAVQVAENQKLQRIGVQSAEKEQTVRIAELHKERSVGEQKAAYEQEIEVKEKEREKRISVAEANSKASIGEQEALFNQEMRVKEAEQAKRISVAAANAKAIEGENISKAAIAESEATLRVKESEAFQLGATRSEEAKAAVLEAKNRALAKAAIADAERVEAERRAELEATAKAEKARTIVEAEAEKEKRRIEAEGEALAIFAKLEAEAKGNYEILKRKGDGLREIVNACGGSDAAFKMLMLEHLDNLANASAKAISNIKFDKVIVWENGSANGNGKGSVASFLNSMANTLPPMMQVMKDVGGVEFPEFLAKITQNDEGNGQEPAAASAEPPAARAATAEPHPAPAPKSPPKR